MKEITLYDEKITSQFFLRLLNRKLTWNEAFGFLFKTQIGKLIFLRYLANLLSGKMT